MYLYIRCSKWRHRHLSAYPLDSLCSNSGLPLAGKCHVGKSHNVLHHGCSNDPADSVLIEHYNRI